MHTALRRIFPFTTCAPKQLLKKKHTCSGLLLMFNSSLVSCSFVLVMPTWSIHIFGTLPYSFCFSLFFNSQITFLSWGSSACQSPLHKRFKIIWEPFLIPVLRRSMLSCNGFPCHESYWSDTRGLPFFSISFLISCTVPHDDTFTFKLGLPHISKSKMNAVLLFVNSLPCFAPDIKCVHVTSHILLFWAFQRAQHNGCESRCNWWLPLVSIRGNFMSSLNSIT